MSSLQEQCQRCGRVTHLDVCFVSHQRLCKNCSIDTFQEWKSQQTPASAKIEANLDFYKKEIDALTPILNSNLKSIQTARDQIEEAYSYMLDKLNLEKNQLIRTVNDCEADNKKFLNFVTEISTMKQGLADFRESAGIHNPHGVSSLVSKFNQSNQFIIQAEQRYKALMSQPVKTIERFEPIQQPMGSTSYIGTLRVNNGPVNHAVSRMMPVYDPMMESATHSLSRAAINPRGMFPVLFMATPAPLPPQPETNQRNFGSWSAKAEKSPFLEAITERTPIFLASHQNYLFTVDENQMVSVFSITNTNLEHHNIYKIPVPNIRATAASAHFFGLTYSGLDKKIMKAKKCPPHGAVLYKRNQAVINFSSDEFFDLGDGPGFEAPIDFVGIAINDEHLFVSDKNLKSVFKIDIRTKRVINRITLTSGEPYKLAVNQHFLVITDPVSHYLNLYDVNSFTLIRNLFIDQPDKANGPFTVHITTDNIIFFKNYPHSQLSFVDLNLSNDRVFKKIPDQIEGFTVLENGQVQTLVAGCTNKSNKKEFKLICFNNM